MHRTILCVVLTFMAVFSLWVYGCGDSDLLDELNQRYTATVSFEDAEQGNTLTIDVWQNTDCDGDGNATDPEIFTDVLATVTVEVDEEALGITLDGYTIDYIPETSTYVGGGGGQALPPELRGLDDRGSNTFSIPSNGSGSFTITCMTISTKQEYVDALSSSLLSLGDTARYTIRITLYFLDEVGVERVIEVSRTVYLNAYDNC